MIYFLNIVYTNFRVSQVLIHYFSCIFLKKYIKELKKMNIHQRFKLIRKELKMTQTELGEKIGKKLRTIQDYEYEKATITDGVLLNLQIQFNINPEWMKSGTGSMFLSDTKKVSSADNSDISNNFVDILEYPTVKASAGYGAQIVEAESVPYQIHKKFVENTDKEMIIGVIGDSMQPELYENDKILITTDFKYTSNPKKNSLYVIGIGDDVYIKRYKYKRDNELIFSSDNKKYDDIKLNINDGSIRIIGKLKLVIREYN